MKPIYFVSESVLSIHPLQQDEILGVLKGDLPWKEQDKLKQLYTGDLKNLGMNFELMDVKINLTWLGGCIAVTKEGEYIKGGNYIPDSLFLAPGKWDDKRPPNILGKEFFKLDPAQKKTTLIIFTERESINPIKPGYKNRREPFNVVYGLIAYTNLIGSYTIG